MREDVPQSGENYLKRTDSRAHTALGRVPATPSLSGDHRTQAGRELGTFHPRPNAGPLTKLLPSNSTTAQNRAQECL